MVTLPSLPCEAGVFLTMTIDRIISNMQQVSVNEVIADSMEATRGKLAAYQRDQMLHGETSEGKKIGRYKNPDYARKKFAMNQLAGLGNMDFKLTGDFHREVIIDVRERLVVFDSGDSKTPKLLRIAPNVFGLNADNRSSYSLNVLRPEAVERIKSMVLK